VHNLVHSGLDFRGCDRHKGLLTHLSAWSTLGPAFLQTELDNLRLPQDFSFGEYNRMVRVQQYRVTRDWGWTSRDWSLDFVTEFYQFYRFVTFKWAQAVLWEHIVSELNILLSEQNIAASIGLQNVPVARDILAVREKLKQGTIDFAGVNKAVGLSIE
jgi:hypothetical protein